MGSSLLNIQSTFVHHCIVEQKKAVMRKIILGVAVSLDGLIEGPSGEYDWCFTDQDYGMGEFLKGVDALFFGRKSYEMMAQAGGDGPNPFGKKRNYVFSATKKFEGEDLETIRSLEEVKKIKALPGKNIWLFGGSSLAASLINAGMVDELWLAVHPIVLGKGKPLFSGVERRIPTKLLQTISYDTGLVSLKYEVLPGQN